MKIDMNLNFGISDKFCFNFAIMVDRSKWCSVRKIMEVKSKIFVFILTLYRNRSSYISHFV